MPGAGWTTLVANPNFYMIAEARIVTTTGKFSAAATLPSTDDQWVGLLAAFAAEEAGENIEAERHRLESEKEDDEIVAAGEKHHSCSGEKHQRVVFAMLLALELHVTDGEQDDERCRR